MAELRRRFPGRVIEHPPGPTVTAPAQERGGVVMSKIGTCVNCHRGPMALVKQNLCGTCDKAAGNLIGKAREKALEEIRGKIERGEVKPRGINAKRPAAVAINKTDNGGTFSEAGREALAASVKKALRGDANDEAKGKLLDGRLSRMVDELEALGCTVTVSLSIEIGGRS